MDPKQWAIRPSTCTTPSIFSRFIKFVLPATQPLANPQVAMRTYGIHHNGTTLPHGSMLQQLISSHRWQPPLQWGEMLHGTSTIPRLQININSGDSPWA